MEKVHIFHLLIHQERWKGQKSCSAVKMTRLWIFSKIITRQAWDSHVIFKAHPTYFRQHIINAKRSIFSKYLFTTLQCYSSKWGFLPWPVYPTVTNILLLFRVMQPSPLLIQLPGLSFAGCSPGQNYIYMVIWEGTLCNTSISKGNWARFQTLKIPFPQCFRTLWLHSTITLSGKKVFYLPLLF